MTTQLPDSRAVVADISTDIEAAAMRAHEALNGASPYSMSSPQFRLAGMALQIASLARQMRDEIAASYPPPPPSTGRADELGRLQGPPPREPGAWPIRLHMLAMWQAHRPDRVPPLAPRPDRRSRRAPLEGRHRRHHQPATSSPPLQHKPTSPARLGLSTAPVLVWLWHLARPDRPG